MDKTDFTIFAPSKKKHLMAKKKADLQAGAKPENSGEQPAVKEKSAAQDTQPASTIPAPDENKQPVPKAAKKAAQMPVETIQDVKPLKTAAKKAATTKSKDITVSDSVSNSSLPAENTASGIPDEPKPAKKVAAKKTAVKKAKPAKDEAIVLASDKSQATTTETGSSNKAVEKNEAFLHKLADVAEHHHEIHPKPEVEKGGMEAEPVEEKILSVKNNELNIRFIVDYFTKPGQSLFITAQHPLFGNGNPAAALPMSFLDDQHWQAEISLKKGDAAEIVYNYILREEDGSLVYDGGKDKKVIPSSYDSNNIVILDAWDFEGYYDNAFFTEPFKEVLLKKNNTPTKEDEPAHYTHFFKIKA